MFLFRQQTGSLDILKDGSPVAVQNASPAARPYLHPMWAPDGIGIVTQNAPPTHPWQHGLYFGLNKVNGVGFWTEGLRPKSQATDGKVVTTRLTTIDASETARWRTEASWRGISREEILTDSVDWTLAFDHESYWLDATWQLTAKIDAEFGKHTAYAACSSVCLSKRRRRRLRSCPANGATTPDAAEGQRARWLAVAASLRERSSLAVDRRHVASH